MGVPNYGIDDVIKKGHAVALAARAGPKKQGESGAIEKAATRWRWPCCVFPDRFCFPPPKGLTRHQSARTARNNADAVLPAALSINRPPISTITFEICIIMAFSEILNF